MWLESHANLARHPKTRRLMKRLGWSLPDTIGNLHLFWYWALDFAPTGDLTPYTPEELTTDLDLLGRTPEEFIESMVAAGFLDSSADCLSIHDWQEYKRPEPRRKALATSSPRPTQVGQGPNLPVPPRRDALPRLSSDRAPAMAEKRTPNLVVPPRRDEPHVATPRISSPDFATPNSDSISDQPSVAQPGEPSISVPLPSLSSIPTEAGGNPDLVVPPLRDATAAIVGQDNATLADSAQRTAAEDLEHRKGNLYRLPGFAKHWWPMYLDFHKKAGTPLNSEARAKLLAQLAKDPLSAVQKIKAAITKTVRTNFADREGILEHAP